MKITRSISETNSPSEFIKKLSVFDDKKINTDHPMSTNTLISIVIPALNEEANVPIIYQQLCQILKNENFELIFIDDGSTDGTASAIEKISQTAPQVRGLSFVKNFGHQAALKAGFDHALGDCVITLDCDLEHPPEYITQMLQLWRDGSDVVITTRAPTNKLPLFKRLSSRLFYGLLNSLTDYVVEPGSADFRLLDQKVVNLCREIKDSDLFWRGIIPQLGFKTTYIKYYQGLRTAGQSKYSVAKMIKLSLAGFTSSSLRPLYLGFYLGTFLIVPACFYFAYQLEGYFLGRSASWDSKSVVAAIFLVGGLQFLVLGIMGTYLGKLMTQFKNRPQYVVSRAIPSKENSKIRKAV